MTQYYTNHFWSLWSINKATLSHTPFCGGTGAKRLTVNEILDLVLDQGLDHLCGQFCGSRRTQTFSNCGVFFSLKIVCKNCHAFDAKN